MINIYGALVLTYNITNPKFNLKSFRSYFWDSMRAEFTVDVWSLSHITCQKKKILKYEIYLTLI